MSTRIENLAALLLTPGDRGRPHAEIFQELGFSDPRKACSIWEGMIPPLPPDPQAAARAATLFFELAGSPDPDMALLNVRRFADATISPAHFLGSIYLEKPLCRLLVTICSCSYYLTDILVRNPGYFAWLIESSTLEAPKSHSTYAAELNRQVAPFSDRRRRLNSIKRYRRREVLRIGARDLLGLASVEEVTAELSFLADAVIDATVTLAFEETAMRYGLAQTRLEIESTSPFHRFAVISLGKLGGWELNYSSDVDLLYVCETNEGKREGAFYTELARLITNDLTSPTEEGTLYRVDLRLRPDGESGPLVVTVEAHLNYLLRRARPWEKQALLKARHSAGNTDTAELFEHNCSSVIFSPISGSDPLAEISTMRERSIAHLSPQERDRNIKLMSGGVRDIEFIAQAYQLVIGRSRPEIRSRNTLEALERLRHFGLLDEDVWETLGTSYRLFRTIEHRLQMIQNVRTHTLPSGERELHALGAQVARSALEGVTADNFRSEISRSVRRVRKLYDSFFRNRHAGEIPVLLSLPATEREVERILLRFGIREGEVAHRFLSSLVYGDFPRLEGPDTLQAALRCLPPILERISATPDPSLTLRNLVRIIKATGAVRSTLELLAGGGDLLKLLLALASLSTRLTETMASRIELLDFLAEGIDPGEPPKAAGNEKMKLKILKRWYETALLYTHCQRPVPDNGPGILGPLHSDITEKALRRIFEICRGTGTQLSLFALGSLGSRRCSFGSDIDLVAVAGDDGNLDEAAETVRYLVDGGRSVGIGAIDLRLRGEGDGSPLVQTVGRYGGYFATRASTWEMLAFAKCRFICGDAAVAAAFETIARRIAGRFSGISPIGEELLATRRRLESLSAGPWDVKHAPGGIYDIDFILTSAYLLGALSEPPGADVEAPLDRLTHEGFLEAGDAPLLHAAFRLYYLVEHAASLHGFPYPPLPEREEFMQRYLDRLLGHLLPGDGVFSDRLKGLKESIRTVFAAYCRRMQ